MRLLFWVMFGIAVLIFFIVVELSRRDSLDKQAFFIGMSFSIGLAVFAVLPDLLRGLSDFMGFRYTFVFTSTIGIIAVFLLNLYTLSKLSRFEEEFSGLIQKLSRDREL